MMNISRRHFIYTSTASVIAMHTASLSANPSSTFSFHCFSKHLQWLDYADAARVIKAAGFDGVDLTVRPGGHVEPERVEDDLPKAVEAFTNAGLTVPMIVCAIKRADEPFAEKTLKIAKSLGVEIYRMGYLKYDKDNIERSIKNLRPQVQELADLNRQIGITGAYQNHAGTNIGAPVWDLRQLLRGIAKEHLGIQYDIKHATAEGGRSWELGFKLVAEHINCFAIKDFLWLKQENGTWRDRPVPMGSGMTNYDRFFKLVKELKIVCPMTLHLEFQMPHILYKDASQKELMDKEIAVYSKELTMTRNLMETQHLLGKE